MSEAEDLFVLRDDMDRRSQRFEKAAAATSDVFTGHDMSGSVTVTVTAEGRLKDIRIADNWRTRLAPADLGLAVMNAVGTAGLSRVEKWGTAMAEDLRDEKDPPVRPLRSMTSSLSERMAEITRGNASTRSTEVALEALAELAREVRASVREAKEEIKRLQGAQIKGRSPKGSVEVVLSGLGDLRGVRYDGAWLERAHTFNIARETLAALASATSALPHNSAAEAVASTRLGQLQALMDDPSALSERLRMRSQ